MRFALVLAATFATASCNQVFGIDGTDLQTPLDEDGDEVGIGDNCPQVANPEQRDLDQDGIGDVCDNCPMAANTDQGAVGDGDAFGDACDPHADQSGDCLIVYDTFKEPDAFATAWTVSDPVAEPLPGSVRVPATARTTLFARGSDGSPLQGDFDITVLADVPAPMVGGRLAVVTHASASAGNWCSLLTANGLGEVGQVAGAPDQWMDLVRGMASPPLGTRARLQLRHIVNPAYGARLSCRIDHGNALGTQYFPIPATPPGSSVGIIVEALDVELHGVVISRHQPGVPCPDPIIR